MEKKLSGRDSKCGSIVGSGGPDPPPPPGKSQVIWVSIGYKQLDPPGKSGTPPPPPGKCWTPSGTLKNDSFLRNQPFDFSKISWGLKKNVVRAFYTPRKLCLWWVYCFHVVRVCVRVCVRVSMRASVRPSVTFCFLNILNSQCWIFIKPCKHVHICKTNTLYKKVRARGQFY